MDEVTPPFLYLLSPDDATPDEPLVYKHQLEDGRTALLAYTALDRLVDHCGPRQRWTLAVTAELRAFAPYDVVVLDHPAPAGVGRPAARDDAASARARQVPPPVVYLPVHAGDGAMGPGDVVVRTLPDGRRALVAYTALDRLAAGCGPQQPWVAVTATDLASLRQRQPYDLIIADRVVPERYRSGGRIA